MSTLSLRSLRVRLTLWYVVLLAVILAAFCAGLYVALRASLYDNLDNALESQADLVRGTLVYEDGRPTLPGDTDNGTGEIEEFARIFDTSGDVTYDNSVSAGGIPVDKEVVEATLSGETGTRNESVDGETLRIRTTPIFSEGRVAGAVEVGTSEDDVRQTLRDLILIMAVAYPLTLVVASAGGIFLAGRALSPIDRVTRLAHQITAEDLSQRLRMDLPDDEVGRLARTFDEMIARLDAAFRRQRQFTADASHELRTPLTAIKGQAEVALQRERDADGYKRVLATINGEVDRMIRLVGSLLTLARADAGEIPMVRERIDIGGVVAGAADQLRPAAETKGIALTVEGGPAAAVMADQDLLLQLILNLLDNAVKYTPTGGRVTIGWSREGADVVIRVTDTGAGIAPEHAARIFDRFYRVDPARSRAEGGAGLGLSISRWIAEAHGGSIRVESARGTGSTFIVRLPAA